MIRAEINNADVPIIKCYICETQPTIKAVIHNMPSIKGVVKTETPFIIGRIKKAIDHEPEPYYEVANQYGTTIIIGD